MVAIWHSLPHLTSDDLWPPWRSSSFLACITNSFDQIWLPYHIVYPIWPLMTFDLHQGHHHSQLASALLLTKYGSHSTYFTPFDLWWPLTSIKVIIILSLHQHCFWPNMVAMAHSLHHLTSDDLWPPSRSSSFAVCISTAFDQIW